MAGARSTTGGGRRSVLVIGAGPAGLAASLKLRAAGFRVTLIDEEGGVVQPPYADAVPCVVLGADHATTALLGQLGTATRVQFPRGLHYEFYAKPKRITKLRRPPAPASLRAILSLATFPTLPLGDRRRILSFLERTWEKDPPLDLDLDTRPADRWLAQIGQSEQARRLVWSPLARFLLGDDLSLVSARLYADTLGRCFLSDIRNARFALPSDDLLPLLLEPARRHLVDEGATVQRSSPVKILRFDAQRVTEIQAGDGRILRAEWYVLDIAHQRFSALLPDRMLARYAYFQQIGKLQDVPAITVHLWLADAPYEPRLLVLADHVFHWITSRRVVQDGRTLSLVSLVAIGTTIPKDRPDAFLVRTATDLVMEIFELKASPTVWHSMVVRTPQAQLSVGPGSSALRPLQQSPVSNLFVAGSWTDTGLPGTTESAIRSGNLCAEAIVARSTKSAP